jgi:hypothetical protein
MEKIVKISVAAVSVIATAFMVWLLVEGDQAIIEDTSKQDLIVGNFLNLSYLLMAVATGSAIIFSLLNMSKNPKSLKRALIGVGALVVITLVGYLMADGSDFVTYNAELGVTESASKWSGAGLNAFYLIMFVTIGAVLYAELSRFFK